MTLLSEHIAVLQQALAKHGDLPIARDDSEGYDFISSPSPEVLRRVGLVLYRVTDFEEYRVNLERKQELLIAAEETWVSLSLCIREHWGSQERYLAQVRSNFEHSQLVVDGWEAAEKFILI